MVQWLGSYAFTAEGMGSIPGWGTKTPQAEWPPPKNIIQIRIKWLPVSLGVPGKVPFIPRS